MQRSSNIIIKILITAIAGLCVLTSACTIKYYDTDKLLNDYKTEGFLDRDHFQVVVTGIPDKESRGLVYRREAALRNAKSKLEDTAVERLSAYSLDSQVKKLNLKNVNDILNKNDIKSVLNEKMREFLKYGFVAFEYYNEDCSAVLVYRIFKDDLVDDIDSVKSDFKIKKQN
ncbi:MAG: hypothetical protein MUC95_01255 [Spirochaetes bacterium]|nr:hypothetical protein [Spirochaetota bacterium]